MDIKDLEIKLTAIVAGLKNDLSALRANRPSPKIIEDIGVEYFGQKLPLKQLGSISVAPPRELQVSAWDKNALPFIAKAIESANLGLSVAITGNIIRVNLPILSDERRLEIIKIAKGVSEEARVKMRGVRDEFNKKVERAEKAKELTEDDKFALKKKSQEAVDKVNKEIDAQLALKTREISD